MSPLSSSLGTSVAGVGRNILLGKGEPRSSLVWALERFILHWALPRESDTYMTTHNVAQSHSELGLREVWRSGIPGSLRPVYGLPGTWKFL